MVGEFKSEQVGDFVGIRITGTDRGQSTLLPECLDDWIDESNPVRVIDAFVDALDLAALGFGGMEPSATRQPGTMRSAAG